MIGREWFAKQDRLDREWYDRQTKLVKQCRREELVWILVAVAVVAVCFVALGFFLAALGS